MPPDHPDSTDSCTLCGKTTKHSVHGTGGSGDSFALPLSGCGTGGLTIPEPRFPLSLTMADSIFIFIMSGQKQSRGSREQQRLFSCQGEALNVPMCHGGAMAHDCYHLPLIQRWAQEIKQGHGVRVGGTWPEGNRIMQLDAACRERDSRKELLGTCVTERGGAYFTNF